METLKEITCPIHGQKLCLVCRDEARSSTDHEESDSEKVSITTDESFEDVDMPSVDLGEQIATLNVVRERRARVYNLWQMLTTAVYARDNYVEKEIPAHTEKTLRVRFQRPCP